MPRFQRSVGISVTLSMLFLLGACSNDESVARVGNERISKDTLVSELSLLPGGERRAMQPGGYRAELDHLIDLMVAEKEGKSRRQEQDPAYLKRLAAIRAMAQRQERELMYSTLFQDVAQKIQVDDAELQAYYEKNKDRFVSSRMHLRHIVLSDKDGARAAKKRILAGKDFGAVAAEVNVDANLRQKRGDMGSLIRTEIPLPLREVAYGLQKNGQVSEPFEAQGQWHIVQLVTQEMGVSRAFTEVREQLETELKRVKASQEFQGLLQARRKELGVEINEAALAQLGPAAIPAGARPTVHATPLQQPTKPTSQPASTGAH